MKYHFLFFMALSLFLASCKSEEEEAREQVIENVEKSWALLDSASKQKVTYLSIPLGLRLGCTYAELSELCDTLIKNNGGMNNHDRFSTIDIMTKEFGNVEKEVALDFYDNFRNSKNKYINMIAFRFGEYQSNSNLDGGWEKLRDFISSKFDESWKTVDFNLKDVNKKKYGCFNNSYTAEYYKYWVRGNMAVVFNYEGNSQHYPTLTFYNVPKYGANNIKVSIPTDDGDEDYLKYKQYDEKKAMQKRLDQWHKTHREWLRQQ